MTGQTGLRRDLGLLEATAVVVGSMIGVGIFLGPDRIAGLVETPGLILLVWLLGGLIILAGGVSYAELGSLMPESGGPYAYTREAYGNFFAFLSGWSGFFVTKSASTAALAVGFATYLGSLVPLPTLWTTSFPFADRWLVSLHLTTGSLVAVGLITILTLVNVYGVKHAGRVASATMIVKVGALGLLVLGGLALLNGNLPDLTGQPFVAPETTGLLALLGVALIPAFFAYDGWVNSTQVAEEVKDPEKNVPRSLFLGVGLVILVYALTNMVYLLARSESSPFAAAVAAETLAGPAGRVLITVAVMVSIIGTINAVTLSGPRIAYAMARDRHFFRFSKEVDHRYGTPAKAIALQGAWSALLALSGTFDQLLTYVIFVSFIWYGLGAGAVFILRRKWPDRPRPYRAFGYPWVPAAFILVTIAFLVNTVIELPVESIVGLGIVASGIPFYLYWDRRRFPAVPEEEPEKAVAGEIKLG